MAGGGGNQKSTVHEAAPHQRRLMSWSYLQTPGRSAAALRLQAISVTDQMSERRYRPAAQIALVMCLKCKLRGNRNNMRSLLQQLFPFSLCDSSLKKGNQHSIRNYAIFNVVFIRPHSEKAQQGGRYPRFIPQCKVMQVRILGNLPIGVNMGVSGCLSVFVSSDVIDWPPVQGLPRPSGIGSSPPNGCD